MNPNDVRDAYMARLTGNPGSSMGSMYGWHMHQLDKEKAARAANLPVYTSHAGPKGPPPFPWLDDAVAFLRTFKLWTAMRLIVALVGAGLAGGYFAASGVAWIFALLGAAVGWQFDAILREIVRLALTLVALALMLGAFYLVWTVLAGG